MFSVISHELKHIYDIYTIDEESQYSFVKSLYYSELCKGEKDKQFKYFLDLVYTSLEHELVARNTMIYEMFMHSKCDKEILYKEYQKSYMYKSLDILESFNHEIMLNSDDIINKTNKFINKFKGTYCKDINDVLKFYSKWEKFFKDVSVEWKKEGYKVLYKVYGLIKEYKDTKTIRNTQVILQDIFDIYIRGKY